jgi:signal recognition particle GTPase
MKTVVDMDKQPEMLEKLNKGIFTLRDMYEQFQVTASFLPFHSHLHSISPAERFETWTFK